MFDSCFRRLLLVTCAVCRYLSIESFLASNGRPPTPSLVGGCHLRTTPDGESEVPSAADRHVRAGTAGQLEPPSSSTSVSSSRRAVRASEPLEPPVPKRLVALASHSWYEHGDVDYLMWIHWSVIWPWFNGDSLMWCDPWRSRAKPPMLDYNAYFWHTIYVEQAHTM